jgi:hypothetical protein
MSMSEQALETFIKEDTQMLNEGIGDVNESNIDFQGMTVEELPKSIISFEKSKINWKSKVDFDIFHRRHTRKQQHPPHPQSSIKIKCHLTTNKTPSVYI